MKILFLSLLVIFNCAITEKVAAKEIDAVEAQRLLLVKKIVNSWSNAGIYEIKNVGKVSLIRPLKGDADLQDHITDSLAELLLQIADGKHKVYVLIYQLVGNQAGDEIKNVTMTTGTVAMESISSKKEISLPYIDKEGRKKNVKCKLMELRAKKGKG